MFNAFVTLSKRTVKMASLIPGYEYDIFISYRQNDNRYDGWVTEFAANLKKELDATIKDKISVYFDANPQDGLLETHSVGQSLEDKLKCLIFMPILSRTYCDSKSYAWNYEFLPFLELTGHDQLGLNIRLTGGNVTGRVLPVRIHDLSPDDIKLFEANIGVIRSVDFIYKSTGVNRPLRANEDHPQDNLNKTYYRDQINKVANAVDDIINSIKRLQNSKQDAIIVPENKRSEPYSEYVGYDEIEPAVIVNNELQSLEEFQKKGKGEKHRLSAYKFSNLKKLVYTLLVLVPLIALIFSWKSLARITGIGNAKRESARMHVGNAVKLIDTQYYEEAKVEVELALADDPKYSYAWSTMAAVSVKQGNLSKALTETIKAVKYDPTNSQAAYNMGFAFHDKKDYHQAIEWYRKAVKIDSTFRKDSVLVPAISALGNLYNEINQTADAVLILSQAEDNYKASKYIYLVYRNLGNSYLLMGQYDEAIRYLELSRNAKQDEAETNLILARAYEAGGKTGKSIEQWQAYIESETDTIKISDARKHLKEITIKHLQDIIK